MNIKDLKYLVALAEYGHFGKAAEACFVSQPALSMQIRKLEEVLGVKLLERTNKSVLLTECGARVVERAKVILNQVDEVREIAKQLADPFSGELRVGIFPTLAPYLLPHIIPTLSKDYPKLSLFLIEDKTANLIDKLKNGKLDVAILSIPVSEKAFQHEALFREDFLLAVPEHDALAKNKFVNQSDLDGKHLLLLEDGHCMREQSLNICYEMHADEMQNFRATSLETLRQMVVAGVGITLMPTLACAPNAMLRYIPFQGSKPSRTIGLYWRANSSKQVLLSDMIQKIKSVLLKQHSVDPV